MTMSLTVAAHTFDPMKRHNPDGPGLVEGDLCGFYVAINDEVGHLCGRRADDLIHSGQPVDVRIPDLTGEVERLRAETVQR